MCSCRLRKEREEDKIQRLVQEEAVRFLWNQVNSFSPLSFLLTYEFEKHTVDPEEVVNMVHFFPAMTWVAYGNLIAVLFAILLF